MRLAAFNPSLVWCAPSGSGLYEWQLSFDCPLCGPWYKIILCCSRVKPSSEGVWWISIPEVASGDGWNGITLTPSVNNSNHGRKKVCGYHFFLIDGDLREC